MRLLLRALVVGIFYNYLYPVVGECDESIASSFIFPVPDTTVSNPLYNVRNPLDGGWYKNRNDFGNYCPACSDTVGFAYHPGEDWNLVSGDANKTVYAIANGVVIRSHKMSDRLGWAVIIRHELPRPIVLSSYILGNTKSSQDKQETDIVSSVYLHLNEPTFGETDTIKNYVPISIKQGDVVGTIYPYTPRGSHLHFELRGNGDIRTADPLTSSSGYYPSEQAITDFGYIRPTKFILDHLRKPQFWGFDFAGNNLGFVIPDDISDEEKVEDGAWKVRSKYYAVQQIWSYQLSVRDYLEYRFGDYQALVINLKSRCADANAGYWILKDVETRADRQSFPLPVDGKRNWNDGEWHQFVLPIPEGLTGNIGKFRIDVAQRGNRDSRVYDFEVDYIALIRHNPYKIAMSPSADGTFPLSFLIDEAQAAGVEEEPLDQPASPSTVDATITPDFNEDGAVDFGDFYALANAFGKRQGDSDFENRYDLNGDGTIGFTDFVLTARNFGKPASEAVITPLAMEVESPRSAGAVGTMVLDLNPAFGDQGQRQLSSSIKVGDTVRVDIVEASGYSGVAGFQATLRFDPRQLFYGGFESKDLMMDSRLVLPRFLSDGELELNVALPGENGLPRTAGSLGQLVFTAGEGFSNQARVELVSGKYATATAVKELAIGSGGASVVISRATAAGSGTGTTSQTGANKDAVIYLSPLQYQIAKSGEPVRIEVWARGMVNVKQATVTMEIKPASAFNYSSSSYEGSTALPLSPGIEILSSGTGTIRAGSANFINGVSGTSLLGTFILVPAANFSASSTTAKLLQVSLGPAVGELDVVVPAMDNVVSFTMALPPASSPPATTDRIPGDFDGNGNVEYADFFAFADRFGASVGEGRYDRAVDLDGDGTIGFADFFQFADSFKAAVGAPASTPPSGPSQTPAAPPPGGQQSPSSVPPPPPGPPPVPPTAGQQPPPPPGGPPPAPTFQTGERRFEVLSVFAFNQTEKAYHVRESSTGKENDLFIPSDASITGGNRSDIGPRTVITVTRWMDAANGVVAVEVNISVR